MTEYWWEEKTRIKPDRVAVKLYNEDGSFRESIISPTLRYPLTGTPRVFHCKNTKQVSDPKILDIFDRVEYKHGACYSNTENLVAALRKEGYDAKSYVGWLFTGIDQHPIHHCWAVLDNSVLDLSDDFSVMLSGENGKHFLAAQNDPKLTRELIASFAVAATKSKNSIRCSTVGTPTPFLFYVGTPCEPERGKNIYYSLVRKFPDHECQLNIRPHGLNQTQQLMYKAGLMKWIDQN